ncbi:MAG: ABC transporter permease [Gemmataceae bacterium]
MRWMAVVQTLGTNDWRNIRRDALLRWMVVIPLFVAFLVRIFLPVIQHKLTVELGVLDPKHVHDLHLLIMTGFFLLLNPLLVGFVIGLLLLDERDEGTLLALRVSPLSLTHYLLYKLTTPMLVATGMTLVCFPITGLDIEFRPAFVLVVLVASLVAPLMALFMAAFSADKVQGFALMKAANVFLVPPFAAYFFGAWWEVFFGISPVYWIIESFWRAERGDPTMWVFLSVAVVYQLVLIWVLLRRFRIMAT